MGKKSKKNKNKKRRLSEDANDSKATTASASANPLLDDLNAFLSTVTPHERDSFFSNTLVEPERRAELWMQQAELGETLVAKYSWATPDARALAILRHFSPLIEIGCGANAYWCRQMIQAGCDVVGFDRDPFAGGKIGKVSSTLSHEAMGFEVYTGGPAALKKKKYADRTLFLCYPDEEDEELENEDDEPLSMGAACLQHYTGDHVIHVGELFLDATSSMDQAPWGRSSSAEFQQMLAAEFHCILRVRLPTWLHTKDSLSVWKRSETCSIVFAAEGEDDEDEEFQYRHIPVEERLPVDMAAPCVQHLLAVPPSDNGEVVSIKKKEQKQQIEEHHSPMAAGNKAGRKEAETNDTITTGNSTNKKRKKKKHAHDRQKKVETTANGSDKYECPW